MKKVSRAPFKVFSLFLLFSGCMQPYENLQVKRVERLSIGEEGSLVLRKAWPTHYGNYIQSLKFYVGEQRYQIVVSLKVAEQFLEATALHDIMGRLYTLRWTPEGVEWRSSDHVPDFMKPDYILQDFLLSFLTSQQLEEALKGVSFEEKNNFRTLKENGKVIWEIARTNCKAGICKKIHLNQKKRGYKIRILTQKESR